MAFPQNVFESMETASKEIYPFLKKMVHSLLVFQDTSNPVHFQVACVHVERQSTSCFVSAFEFLLHEHGVKMLLNSGPKICGLKSALEFTSSLKCVDNLKTWTLVCEVEACKTKIFSPVLPLMIPFLKDESSLREDLEFVVNNFEKGQNMRSTQQSMTMDSLLCRTSSFKNDINVAAGFKRSFTDSHLQVNPKTNGFRRPVQDPMSPAGFLSTEKQFISLQQLLILEEEKLRSEEGRDGISFLQRANRSQVPLRSWKSQAINSVPDMDEERRPQKPQTDLLSQVLLEKGQNPQISSRDGGCHDQIDELDPQEQLNQLLQGRTSWNIHWSVGKPQTPAPMVPLSALNSLQPEQSWKWGNQLSVKSEDALHDVFMSPRSLPSHSTAMRSTLWDSPTAQRSLLQRAKSDPTSLAHSMSVLSPKFSLGNGDGSENQEKALALAFKRVPDMGYGEISKYFNLPISEACTRLKVGLTVLKKKCRELGIPRWPYRKLKSLDHLIHTIQDMATGPEPNDAEGVRSAIMELETQRKAIHASAATELGEDTRRLRQACFKATYKRRREGSNFGFEEDDLLL